MASNSSHRRKMDSIWEAGDWLAGIGTPTDKYTVMIGNDRYLDKTAVRLKKELFQKVIFGGSKVLDSGCGSGYYLSFAKRNLGVDFDLVGIDISGIAVRKAANLNLTSTCLTVGDAEALPFKDESFDVALSIGVIETVASPEDVLLECLRVLRKGGQFIFFIHKPFIDPLIVPSLIGFGIERGKRAIRNLAGKQSNEGSLSGEALVRQRCLSLLRSKMEADQIELVARKPFIYAFKWSFYRERFPQSLIPKLISFGNMINKLDLGYYKNFEYYLFRKC